MVEAHWMIMFVLFALAFTARALIVAKRREASLSRLVVIGVLGAITASVPILVWG